MTSETNGEPPCIFCKRIKNQIMIEGELAFVSWDSYPVNPGHALVIPYRHVASYFDATDAEKAELWTLVDRAKAVIDEKHEPDSYNIGINIGYHAGQSIPHMHIHVMPRYQGDIENPKGGVRAVIPHRQKYVRGEAWSIENGLDSK